MRGMTAGKRSPKSARLKRSLVFEGTAKHWRVLSVGLSDDTSINRPTVHAKRVWNSSLLEAKYFSAAI